MQAANTGWVAPSIHGELLKLGIEVSQATVSKYLLRTKKPRSQAWRTFLNNHTDSMAAMDSFTVPTASFRVLYVFIVLSHDRRRVVHFNATEHPTGRWTAQQIVEAFPFDSAPRYLLFRRSFIPLHEIFGLTRATAVFPAISIEIRSRRAGSPFSFGDGCWLATKAGKSATLICWYPSGRYPVIQASGWNALNALSLFDSYMQSKSV